MHENRNFSAYQCMENKNVKTDIDTVYNPNSTDILPELKKYVKKGSLPVAEDCHCSMPELRNMVLSRKSWGEFWEMPKHLSTCSACLDSFEVLLKGEDQVEESVLERMRKLHPPKPLFISMLKFEPLKFMKMAAAIAIIIFGGWLAFEFFSPPSIKIIEGSLRLDDGRQMSSGSVMPDGSELTATQSSAAVFEDGSKFSIAKDSKFFLPSTRFHNKVVQLSDGNIVCEVSKQKDGRSFKVQTPAGEIIVVGTKFSVESRMSRNSEKKDRELHFLHPTQVGVRDGGYSDNSVVTVKVQEGVVLVKNRHGVQNRLIAGQTAVLRSGISVIDVFEGTN